MKIGKLDPPLNPQIAKARTGISGLDDVTFGGFPAGRPTLIVGGAGCGKTLLAMTFLVNGATEFNEPGVFMSFEETGEDLAANVASLNVDVPALVAAKKLVVDHVRIERSEIEETGEYDLEGLFVRLDHAIKSVKAKRVVLDTLEALFSGLSNAAVLRAEFRRLLAWLKERGITALITAERGDGSLTRYGIEEYVSDCVVVLDNRVHDQVTTRRLRVLKYRGSRHGTNEYPFLIDTQGITVLPITSIGLAHESYEEVVSTGIPGLDAMLDPGGYYRGSSVLISGVAGTGKSTFASYFANAACGRGDRCLYFAFEESAEQIVRNMRSVGLDLQKHVDAGLLRFEAARPSLYGFEMHLTRMHHDVKEFDPATVIIDPLSAFRGPSDEIYAMLLRMTDLFKSKGITALCTSLSRPNKQMNQLVTSIMDTWVTLIDVQGNGERNRGLYVVKSRGMNHSNQIREYLLSSEGVHLTEPYVGTSGVLTGSARLAQEAREQAEALARRQETERMRRVSARRREALARQIAELQAELEAETTEIETLAEREQEREHRLIQERAAQAAKRGAAE